jgi:DNA repair exonuclease SbcCD ATPase subunit
MTDFKLKRIILEGFRSFKQKTVIQLEREPGLYFVSGNNIINPELGSNAVAKSSIFDSISWVLYGKTVEKLRGQVIINWASKTCTGSLELSKDGQDYIITRTQSPNSLTISPPLIKNGESQETLVQADIDEFMNLTHEKFLYACIVGQFEDSFILDLGPTERLNLFSEIMSLTFWEQCSKRASEQAIHFQNIVNLLEIKKKGWQSTCDDLKAQESALNASSDEFEKNRQKDLAALKQQIRETFSAAIKAEKQAEQNKVQITKIGIKNSTWTQDSGRVKENLEKIDLDQIQINQLMTTAETTKTVLTTELNKWKQLDICPYCSNKADPELITSHKTQVIKQLILLGKELIQLDKKKSSLVEQENINLENLNSLETKIANERDIIDSLNKKYGEALATKQLKLEKLEQLKKSITTLENGSNPYTSLIDSNRTEQNKFIANISELEIELASLIKDQIGNQFWIKGFKELRLWVIQDALLSLEIEANNILAKLGLSEWILKFQIERETSSGDISKGFHALVKPPGTEDYIPLGAYSGGEKQRLKLGGTMGLSSLIQSYKGVNFNLMVLDEPTTFLSGEGTNNLIECLAEEAKASGRVIYFIDHTQIQSPHFKGIIRVEKTKEGSFVYG